VKETILANTPLFAPLTAEQRGLIAERMATESRPAGDLICAHGQPARAMYVVGSGWVRLMNEQLVVLANLGPGSLLGETDVLLGRPYTITAEAATDVTLLALSAADLADIVKQQPEIGRQLRIMAGATEDMDKIRHLRRLALMAGLSTDQLRVVAQHLRAEKFAAGQGIYCRGTFGNALYLIDQGQVAVQRPGQPETILGSGDIFGISALLENEPHTSDVAAFTDVSCWSLSRDDFEKLALRYPILAINLARLLSQQLRQTNEHVTAAIPLMMPAAPAPAAAPAAPVAAPPVAPAARPAVAVQPAPQVPNRAVAWFSALSTGAKLRLVAVVLLLVWLIGIAAPLMIINLLSSGAPAPAARPEPGAAHTLQDRVIRVALAADLPVQYTPTYTPWPTETPIPTPTFTPTATPTNTPIPTPTFTPTATPIPPTDTPVPPVVMRAAVAAAAPPPTPKPSAQFTVIEKRRLTPCENRGKHNIFVKIVDAAGNPVDGVTLVQVPHGQIGNVLDKAVSGIKGPGLAEFVMWKGAEYDVYISADGVNPANTEIAQQLHSNFTDEAMCNDGGGGGNTLFHNSFNVIFQKNF